MTRKNIQAPIDTALTTPADEQARILARNLVKFVQVQHHIQNWNPVPNSITKKISVITENLCPPMVDTPTRSKYKEAGRKFGMELSGLTLNHLHTHSRNLQTYVESSDATHLPLALPIAKKLLKEKQGVGNSDRLPALLEQATQKVGTLLHIRPSLVTDTIPGLSPPAPTIELGSATVINIEETQSHLTLPLPILTTQPGVTSVNTGEGAQSSLPVPLPDQTVNLDRLL